VVSELNDTIGDLLQENMTERIEDAIDAKVTKILGDLTDEEVSRLIESEAVRMAIYNRVERVLPTLIGNRLRCGCWDEGKVRAAFDKHIDGELEKALRDQVRRKMGSIVKEEVERLRHMFDALAHSAQTMTR
jgi:ribosomal protein S13